MKDLIIGAIALVILGLIATNAISVVNPLKPIIEALNETH